MFEYLRYRIGQFIAQSLPRRLAYKIAVLLSDIHYLFARKDRLAVKENLEVIFPQMTQRQICQIRLGIFRNFAKYLADFFRFERIDAEFIKKNIKIEGIHHFDEALKKQKGVIVLTAHLGIWELGGVVIALLGYPFWIVALPHKDKRVDDFFNFQRRTKGVNVIPLGKAVRTCLNLLRQNKMVALAGDRVFTEGGMVLNFFGKPTFFPEGPAAFFLKTQAAIIPGFMLRNKDDSFSLKIEKPIEFNPSGDKKEDIKKLINTYKTVIEDYIKKYPDQWYMFRRFWI